MSCVQANSQKENGTAGR